MPWYIVKVESVGCRIHLLPSGAATGFNTTRAGEAENEFEAVGLSRKSVTEELDATAGRGGYDLGDLKSLS